MTILLGQNSPYLVANAEFIVPLNDVIATVASDLDTTESPVILLGHYTGFDVGSMTFEGVHHSRAGE